MQLWNCINVIMMMMMIIKALNSMRNHCIKITQVTAKVKLLNKNIQLHFGHVYKFLFNTRAIKDVFLLGAFYAFI